MSGSRIDLGGIRIVTLPPSHWRVSGTCRIIWPMRRSRTPSGFAGSLACLLVASAASVASVAGAAMGQSPAAVPVAPSPLLGSPGARSLGDAFYPSLGNGGYDVQQYDLSFDWTPPARPTVPADPASSADLGSVAADVTVRALATQDLSEFSLDLTRANTDIVRASLDDTAVPWSWDAAGRKLVIRPPAPIVEGNAFTLRLVYSARPRPVARTGEDMPLSKPGEDPATTLKVLGRGFLADGSGGFLLAAQPNGAHTLFPANDYPTDKALVTVRLTAPPGMLGVASGALASLTSNADGTTTSVWQSAHPVATHVVGVGVGRYTLLGGTGPDSLPLRFAVPTTDVPLSAPVLARVPAILGWLEQRLGAFPFETFGLLAYAGDPSVAILEAQTLVLMPDRIFDPRVAACDVLGAIAHEASHQWFGDDVSLVGWDEKWLSEGHATFYEWSWRAANGCAAGGIEGLMLDAYRHAQSIRDAGGPPARPRAPAFAYDDTIYGQGALALYALQQEVGPATFATIERTFLERHADGNASTRDFIDVASQISGRDLGGFLGAWLCGAEVPVMPGHPDWLTAARPAEPRPSPSAAESSPAPSAAESANASAVAAEPAPAATGAFDPTC